MSMRMEKINKEIQRVLMEIIQHEVDDPTIGILSITRVETTADLQESKIYYSLLNEENYKKVEQILKKMGGFIRAQLARNIRMRIIPQLKFIIDDSIKYSVDIGRKIDEIMGIDNKSYAKVKDRYDHKKNNQKN